MSNRLKFSVERTVNYRINATPLDEIKSYLESNGCSVETDSEDNNYSIKFGDEEAHLESFGGLEDFWTICVDGKENPTIEKLLDDML